MNATITLSYSISTSCNLNLYFDVMALHTIAVLGISKSTGSPQRNLSKDHDLAIELERRHLFELQLTPKQPRQQSCFSLGMEELKVLEGKLR